MNICTGFKPKMIYQFFKKLCIFLLPHVDYYSEWISWSLREAASPTDALSYGGRWRHVISKSDCLLCARGCRWIGCITLCCMVVLVLTFNYLGLLCGTLGYDKHASPTTRGCISNTGGTMLMAWVPRPRSELTECLQFCWFILRFR